MNREGQRALLTRRLAGVDGEARYGTGRRPPYGRPGARTTEAAAAIKRRNQVAAAARRAALRLTPAPRPR